MTSASDKVRMFETGATRDGTPGKYEYARFMDPRVLREYAGYMHRNRFQKDGSVRDPDNWKKGITRQAYMDSLQRHVIDLWELHDYGHATRPEDGSEITFSETLCAIMFNAMGYLYEVLKGRSK